MADVNTRPTLASELAREFNLAADITAGRFNFLGRKVDMAERVDWHLQTVSQLWRYHLHYFGYVRPLLLAAQVQRNDVAYLTFRRLVQSWMSSNERLRGDGWHPYTLSLRLVNWLQAVAIWAPRLAADPEFREGLLLSVYGQARMLRRQLEFDVRGNHLLENLRGLLWAGVAFGGAEAYEWSQTALRLLQKETAEQVLDDGGHFERTPGYHVIVLKDYLEIALLLTRNAGGCPNWLREAVRRQAFFLREILGPRQRVPLIKDTAYDAAPNSDDILNSAAAWLNEPRLKPAAAPGLETFLLLGEAEWKKVSVWPEAPRLTGGTALSASGFYVLRGHDGEHAIIDAGRPCPDYLPAHAHADTFSFEYHVRGVPVIVDSGVYEYQPGPWRDFFRSTRAHNTLEIHGCDSSEVWASFRVGRRAYPRVKVWKSAGGRAQLLATHDGYCHLEGKPVHERAMLWREGDYLIVLDRVTGAGIFPLVSYLHFHPALEPREESQGLWTIDVHGSPLWLHRLGKGDVALVCGREQPFPQGWYSERFGEKKPNRVLNFRHDAALPHVSGYAFSSHDDFACTIERQGIDVHMNVKFAGSSCSYRVSEGSVECFS